jgi:predicted NBD/HSP70 family sugar kinase
MLLNALRAAGTTSRAQLARTTGLSKPTVSSALANLEKAGLVRPTGGMSQGEGRGRAAVLFEANPGAAHVIGLDVGRKWIRVAVADLSGEIVGRREEPNRARSAAAIVDTAATVARAVADESGVEWSTVVHTVLGSPGVSDPRSHRVRYAVNLPGWGRSGVFERLRDELGTGLDVVNDANLAALGEYAVGAGQGCRLFAYLWVGTGLGAGLVVDGKVFAGSRGAAGEIAYLPMYPLPVEGEMRGDLRRGALEDAVSGDAVVRLAKAMGMAGVKSAKEVFEAAREGSDAARRVVEHEAARLAHAVAALAAVLDPELVVLGGGIGRNADLLLEPLQTTLRDLTPLRPRVVVSKLGEEAVLLGAVATAADVARDRVFEARGAR